MPSLATLYNEFQDKKFVVLAIDIQEKREIVKKYVEQEKLPFPEICRAGKIALSGSDGLYRSGCF